MTLWSGRLVDYLGQGTAASLPAAPTLAPGAAAFYFAYDTVAMYAWNGNTSAWDLITSSGMSNPMTTLGDMIIGGSSGTPARLAAPTTGTTWYLSYVVGTGFAWGTVSGSGDMAAATYDPSGIAQQLVGLTATQILTNKDLSSSTNTLPSNVAKKDGANVFTAQQAVTPARGSMSGAVSINLANLGASTGVTWAGSPVSSNNLFLTVTANVSSLALTNPVDGIVYNFWIIQGTGGSFTIATWPSAFDWGGAGTPTLSTAPGKVDMVAALYGSTETKYRAVFNKGS